MNHGIKGEVGENRRNQAKLHPFTKPENLVITFLYSVKINKREKVGLKQIFVTTKEKQFKSYRVCSHDVTAAMLEE